MRHYVLPIVLVVAGCAGGGDAKGPDTDLGSGPGDWSNPIVGDGELAGTGGGGGGEFEADSMGGASSSKKASASEDGEPSSSAGGSSSGSSGMSSGASSSGASGTSGMSSSGAGSSGESSSGASSPPPGDDDDDSAWSSGGVPPSQYPQAGVLTAGTWDDNKNFPFFTKYRNDFLQNNRSGLLGISAEETTGAAQLFGASAGAKNVLDVSLVIDTTGSMGDEIEYLQREFTSLVSTIESKYPQAQQRWSLVLYKDASDSYIVRWFDFRSDTAELKTKLMTASASGGGDFPEAPDQAIDVANRLSWRRDANVARLMFWIADAPHHDEKATAMTNAIKAARNKNIHIYPVASSGVDDFTEYTMRQTAQLTGGRYIFLTDDSGVGGAHAEPTVPCYFVTKLDKAILRMVDVEFTGTYREPTTDEVIRTAGDPQGGVCQVSQGTVTIY